MLKQGTRMPLSPCDTCFNYTLSACPDADEFIELQPSSGLTDGETYYWWMTDKFDRVYLGSAEYADGAFKIPVDEFAEGYFTQFSGSFELYLTSGVYGDPLELTFGENAYTCILLDFAKMNESILVVK